jgi:hypothetical protein
MKKTWFQIEAASFLLYNNQASQPRISLLSYYVRLDRLKYQSKNPEHLVCV